jgi:Fibronectin type III domain
MTTTPPTLAELAAAVETDIAAVEAAGPPAVAAVQQLLNDAAALVAAIPPTPPPATSPPSVPLKVTATASGTSAVLEWSAPASPGSSPITGYVVSRNGTDSNGTGPWSGPVPANTTTGVFQALIPGDTYDLTVAAVNAVGTGPAASVSVTIPPAGGGGGGGGAPSVAFGSPYPFTGSQFASPLPANPTVNPESATFVKSMLSTNKGFGVNLMPLVRAAAGAATVPLSGPMTPNTGTQVAIPVGYPLNTSTDGPIVVKYVDPSDEFLDDIELWRCVAAGAGYSATWGGRLLDLATSSAVFPGTYGLSASGISYLATMISQDDAMNGAILHAVAFQASTIDAGFVPPAVRQDGNAASHPGYCHEGNKMYLPAAVKKPSGLVPFSSMLFDCLQRFGAYVVDQTQNSGYNMFVAEDPSNWKAQGMTGTDPITASMGGQPAYEAVAPIPWSQLVFSA